MQLLLDLLLRQLTCRLRQTDNLTDSTTCQVFSLCRKNPCSELASSREVAPAVTRGKLVLFMLDKSPTIQSMSGSAAFTTARKRKRTLRDISFFSIIIKFFIFNVNKAFLYGTCFVPSLKNQCFTFHLCSTETNGYFQGICWTK